MNTGWSSCAPIVREPIDFVYLGRPFFIFLLIKLRNRGGGFICKYVCTGVYPLTRHVDRNNCYYHVARFINQIGDR